jgi:hypothetical protein
MDWPPHFERAPGKRLARLYLTPDNLRIESDRCRSERLFYFSQLAKNQTEYQRFLSRELPLRQK